MNIAAVIVFYNPSDNNIKHIKTYKKIIDKFYIIDNSDDEIVRIKSDSKIKYIKYKENKGIAYALNDAATRAYEDGYKWLLTLDQDSLITKENIEGMLEYLIKHQKDKKIGLVSPYQDVGMNDMPPKKEAEDIIEIMTSGNIINLEVYKKIGGFKDWLFIDCVDTDYCMNLHKNGYKVIRLNRIVMKHNLGDRTFHKLFGKIYDCSNHSPIRRYYIIRNNLYIRDMYNDLFPEYCEKLIRIQKGQIKRIIVFEKNKLQKLKMSLKGYRDYKKGIKGKCEGGLYEKV